MKAAAMSTNGIVFVLNHSQIVHEIILGDIDVYLHNGQIPDLFSDDELQVIHRQIMPLAKEAGFSFEEMEDFDTMIEYFEERLKERMTFVLCFSPLGSMLRETLHEYTGFSNCCTVDWYEEWPMEALEAMAHRLLDGVSLDLQSNEGQKLKQDRESSRMRHMKLKRRKRVGNIFDSLNKMVGKISLLHTKAMKSVAERKKTTKGVSRARLDELKLKLKAKVKTISLISMAYFKSKAEQRAVVIESLVELALNIHMFCRDKTRARANKTTSLSNQITTYVTPRNYIDLLSTFKNILVREQLSLGTKKRHYESGISKIDYAASEVGNMREELHEIQPILQNATIQTANLLKKLEERMPHVRSARDLVQADQARIQNEEVQIHKIKKQVESELRKCKPQLQQAISALDTLTTKDISLMKTMKNPPRVIKMVMETVCLLMKLPPHKTKTTEDYWKPSIKFLNKRDFIQQLQNFDKDGIPLSIITTIRQKYISDADFNPKRIKKASRAAEGICKWVLALEKYDSVLRQIRPKQQKIVELEVKLQETRALLQQKQEHLKSLESDIKKLEVRFEQAGQEQKDLKVRVDTCTRRVKHAEILLKELGGERDLWFEISQKLSRASETVLGDMFILAAIVAYSGSSLPNDRKSFFRCLFKTYAETVKFHLLMIFQLNVI